MRAGRIDALRQRFSKMGTLAAIGKEVYEGDAIVFDPFSPGKHLGANAPAAQSDLRAQVINALASLAKLDTGMQLPAVLEHFDLTIPAGSSLAIVGQNGAGKSLILSTLLESLIEIKRQAYHSLVETPKDEYLRLQKKDYVRAGQRYSYVNVEVAEGQSTASLRELVRQMPHAEFQAAYPAATYPHLQVNDQHFQDSGFHKYISAPKAVQDAIKNVENNGIVFLDEIDKICARTERIGADVSREGVQRDLLPLIEGTTVSTKYGPVKTDHILFIASGAFHIAKPSDLLPELQGRLPIRVELRALTRDDFCRILTEPKASLIKQYVALMETEGVALTFTDDAIDRLAGIAVDLNASVENIGARRLQTVMERVLDDISFNAPDKSGSEVTIDADYVDKNVGDLARNTDLSRFIL